MTLKSATNLWPKNAEPEIVSHVMNRHLRRIGCQAAEMMNRTSDKRKFLWR